MFYYWWTVLCFTHKAGYQPYNSPPHTPHPEGNIFVFIFYLILFSLSGNRSTELRQGAVTLTWLSSGNPCWFLCSMLRFCLTKMLSCCFLFSLFPFSCFLFLKTGLMDNKCTKTTGEHRYLYVLQMCTELTCIHKGRGLSELLHAGVPISAVVIEWLKYNVIPTE